MLVEGQRYRVVMSQTCYHWLMFTVLKPILGAGPSAWPQGGRVAFGRLETLYAHGKQVEIAQQGRFLRLTLKDARTVMGLVELARAGRLPAAPRSARSLYRELGWQVGDTETLPGALPEPVRAWRLIPLGNGKYLSQGGGSLLIPGVTR